MIGSRDICDWFVGFAPERMAALRGKVAKFENCECQRKSVLHEPGSYVGSLSIAAQLPESSSRLVIGLK